MSMIQAKQDTDYLKSVIKIGSAVYEVAQSTPLSPMDKLSKRLNNNIFIKREDLQPVHSFKLRGAYAMISNLNDKQKASGVIAASAGNHAQGVALSAKKVGTSALIVMPQNTPSIKVDAVRGYGGDVLLFGANFDEAKAKAIQLSEEKGMTFIPPFDHPEIIAGQGTIAIELLQQNANIDRIFVPVGGGGLAAGIAVIIKKLMPEIKVIGVESKDSACLAAALHQGSPVDLDRVGIFADGVAVKRIGDETFRLLSQYIDDVVLVSSDEICSATKDIFEDTRAIAEPAGALSLAGLKKYVAKHNISGENLINILSGANLNFHSLRYISERCDLGEKSEALLAVTIPETKGSFLKFCHILGSHPVSEFSYRFSSWSQACVFVGVKIKELSEKENIINNLRSAGYDVADLSDDETAKTHIRYMIGGKIQSEDEQLYSFEFPEQKGALLKFLQTLGTHWNISMFHYRHYGGDYSSVLCAFQLSESTQQAFDKYLKELGYPWQNVSSSKAYDLFLR